MDWDPLLDLFSLTTCIILFDINHDWLKSNIYTICKTSHSIRPCGLPVFVLTIYSITKHLVAECLL